MVLVPRKANEATDWVSRNCRMKRIPLNWVEEPPDDLCCILIAGGLPGPPEE